MKVILHKLFPYAPYLNEYIGFERDAEDFEDPLAVAEELRKLAEKSHRDRYPHLYPNGSEAMVESFAPPVQQVQKTSKEERIDAFIATINYCNKPEFLKNFKTRVDLENDPRLTEAYDNKLKSFQ